MSASFHASTDSIQRVGCQGDQQPPGSYVEAFLVKPAQGQALSFHRTITMIRRSEKLSWVSETDTWLPAWCARQSAYEALCIRADRPSQLPRRKSCHRTGRSGGGLTQPPWRAELSTSWSWLLPRQSASRNMFGPQQDIGRQQAGLPGACRPHDRCSLFPGSLVVLGTGVCEFEYGSSCVGYWRHVVRLYYSPSSSRSLQTWLEISLVSASVIESFRGWVIR